MDTHIYRLAKLALLVGTPVAVFKLCLAAGMAHWAGYTIGFIGCLSILSWEVRAPHGGNGPPRRP